MRFSTHGVWITINILVQCSAALELPQDHILKGGPFRKREAATPSQSPEKDSPCENGPTSRQCWDDGYSVSTDFDQKWPVTGTVRKFNFEITNTTCAPDGIRRECFLINNQFPGPPITADWGDYIEVTVKNSLTNNGTGIHFHGVRQLYTNTEDGTGGLTECPIAPGFTRTYRFNATQYGTSWYHSHYTVQYGEGILGPIVINGPATANYDIDLGAYPVSDWVHNLSSYQFLAIADAKMQLGQGPPPQDNILINGTNKNGDGDGSYSQVTLSPGKTHRLRLINTAAETSMRVTLDGHAFTVIASDFVPVEPFAANQLLLAIGQRYDVLVEANQTAGNYWFRAVAASDCASNSLRNGSAIFTYEGTPVADPQTQSVALESTCRDPLGVVPWWTMDVPSTDFQAQARNLNVDIGVPKVTTNQQNVIAWTINMTSIAIAWDRPTLEYVINDDTNYPAVYNVIEITQENIWTYWIIQEPADTPVPIAHPMHLHGHDFWILGTGTGVFDPSTDTGSLSFTNPPRRDTTMLPAAGWLVLAFPADNPGAWLMHCHIGTHIAAGLGVQFLENKDKIRLPPAGGEWEQQCDAWDKYYATLPDEHVQNDSGL